MSVGTSLTLVGILLTFASVTFAGRQLQRSRRTSQADFLFKIIIWYLDDTALRKLFYKLDYNRWEFNPETFPGSEDEPLIDKMLYVFDLLEHLIESKQVSLIDVRIISFEASRVLHNPQVERYLDWLDKEFRQVRQPTPAYAGARKFAEQLPTIDIADGTPATVIDRNVGLHEHQQRRMGDGR